MIKWLKDMLYFDGCYAWLEIDMGNYSIFIGVYDGPLLRAKRWAPHNTTKLDDRDDERYTSLV